MAKENPAVTVAKEQESSSGIHTLSTGIRVRFRGVSGSLIDEVRSRIEFPEVPRIFDEDKQRELENPNDPVYLREVERTETRRNLAATDAMILFGVELVDPVPEDDDWVKRLKFVNIEFDADDALTREFAYKKYVAFGVSDIQKLLAASMVSQEGIKQAEASFPGAEEGRSDTEPET